MLSSFLLVEAMDRSMVAVISDCDDQSGDD